jgi:hypothetical protein
VGRALSKRWAGSCGSSMGLIASIFAYLSAVTVLVAALLTSFDAFLYPPGPATIGQQTVAAAAKPSVAPSTSMWTTSSVRPASPTVTEAAAGDPHAGSENTVSERPRVRRSVRQERASNWLSQQEPKALGYAEEPSASFLYDRFQ